MKKYNFKYAYFILFLTLLIAACSPYHHRMVRVKKQREQAEKRVKLLPSNKKNDAVTAKADKLQDPINLMDVAAPKNYASEIDSKPLQTKQSESAEEYVIHLEPKVQPTDTIDPKLERAIREVRNANIWAWVSLVLVLLSFPFILPALFAFIASGQALRRYKRYYVEGLPQYYWLAKVVRIVSLVFLSLILLYLIGIVLFLLLFW